MDLTGMGCKHGRSQVVLAVLNLLVLLTQCSLMIKTTRSSSLDSESRRRQCKTVQSKLSDATHSFN
jgi:hypothetical protein